MAELTRKPLEWFTTAKQVRQHFDEGELESLGASLKAGQLQPVLANSSGTLLAGERRLRAAERAGLKDLLVIISDEDLSESQIRILQLSENIHRADLTDAEKWRAFEELLRLNPGWSNKDLAQHLKLSGPMICKYLSPSRCSEEVQKALEAGQIGITTCYEISRAEPEQHDELLKLKQAGASRDGLAKRIRNQRKPSGEQVRMKRIVCPLASGIRISVAGQDLSLEELIDALGDAQKEARKAREQKLDIKTWQSVMRDKFKAGEAS